MPSHQQYLPKTSLFPLDAKGQLQRPKTQNFPYSSRKAAMRERIGNAEKSSYKHPTPSSAPKSGIYQWENINSSACSANM